MIVVIAKLVAQPGARQELVSLAKDVIATTRNEQGCVSYTLLQDPYDDSKLCFVEEWQTLDDLRAHSRAPHLITWGKQSGPLVVSRDLKVYDSTATSL